MNARIKWDKKHWLTPVLFYGITKGTDALIADEGFTVKAGSMLAYGVANAATIEAKKKARWKRIQKQVAAQQRGKEGIATNAGTA